MHSRSLWTLCLLLILIFITQASISAQALLQHRLEQISRQFLGKPYRLGALGEGENGRYDQSPFVRMDAFDCETFVDTVLALTFTENPQELEQCIRKIRYKNGRIDYLTRNHFTSLDWNINNRQQGFLKDITQNILDKENHPVACTAIALIDKPGWIQKHTLDNIKLQAHNPQEEEKRLAELKQRGKTLPMSKARIDYLPLTALFDTHGNPNLALFAQIPNGAVIEIVRPNWDLTQSVGTHLNVSHMGFAFRNNGKLIFRNASSSAQRVIDIDLIDYLKNYIKSPTIKGIHVQVVLSGKACRKK